MLTLETILEGGLGETFLSVSNHYERSESIKIWSQKAVKTKFSKLNKANIFFCYFSLLSQMLYLHYLYSIIIIIIIYA